MSIAEKLITVSENVEKVYEAGQKSEYDKFWDVYQDNGNLKYYSYTFAGWPDAAVQPKYDIKGMANMQSTFYNCQCTDLVQRFKDCGITFDSAGSAFLSSVFQNCSSLTIPVVDATSATSMSYCFASVDAETIEIIISEKTTFSSNTFQSVYSTLKNLILHGTLAKNGLALSSCSGLTYDSLMNLIDCLKDYSDYTGTTVWKVTLGTTNLNKLTDEEKAIATEKGWTLV